MQPRSKKSALYWIECLFDVYVDERHKNMKSKMIGLFAIVKTDTTLFLQASVDQKETGYVLNNSF